MDTYELRKQCEVCQTPVPDGYGNLLCLKHYAEQDAQPTGGGAVDAGAPPVPDGSLVSDPDYREREEVAEIDLVSRCHGRFKGTGLVMPASQRKLYERIRDSLYDVAQVHPQWPKFVWNPNVVDVGCGLGIGTNILSPACNFVWGVDRNPENVAFARQMFGREKSTAYFTPQVTFDEVDVKDDPREFMKFDVVVCVEVIEHLKDPDLLLAFLKRVAGKDCVTYISTPNRNAWAGTGRDKEPLNEHHVREFTAKEFRDYLLRHYRTVELLDHCLVPAHEETVATPIVAKCLL